MNAQALSPEIVSRINSSIEKATGLPNHAYTSEAFFEQERKTIFSKNWTCIGHSCSLPDSYDAVPIRFMGIPLLIARNEQNEINVFHNVCSHRGNELVWEKCSGRKMLTCPYHSWSYDFNGQLKATPHIGGYGVHHTDGFDNSRNGLRKVRSAVWMDLIFINLDENQLGFRDYIGPLEQRMLEQTGVSDFSALEPAATHGTLELNLEANWKLILENNLESYHLPWVHPDLNAISKLEDHYHFYGDDLYAGQGTKAYSTGSREGNPTPRFETWPDELAEYPTLFPNVFLGYQSDHFWSIVITPIAPGQSRENLQIYYLGDSANSDEYEATRKSQLEAWTKVFNEDVSVVEGMQRGRQSPAFSGGAFSPVMDNPTHHFNKWVAKMVSV